MRFVAFNGIQVDDMAGIGHGSTVSDSVHRWKEAGDDQAMWDTPPVLGRTLRIGKGVWVGNNCVITGGFDVGDRAIIRPNSVVTFEVPANTIVGGSPACVERRRRPDGGWERLPEPVPLDEYQAKAGRSPRASSTG